MLSKIQYKKNLIKKYGKQVLKLGKTTDRELARLLGISSERIRQFRNRLEIPRFDNSVLIEKTICKFIKNNKHKINVSNYTKKYKHSTYKGVQITRNTFKRFAKKLNIKIKFTHLLTKSQHGLTTYITKKCRCKICKLSNTLRCVLKTQGISLKYEYCNILANKHIKRYINDVSTKRYKFYKFIRTQIKVHMLNKSHFPPRNKNKW